MKQQRAVFRYLAGLMAGAGLTLAMGWGFFALGSRFDYTGVFFLLPAVFLGGWWCLPEKLRKGFPPMALMLGGGCFLLLEWLVPSQDFLKDFRFSALSQQPEIKFASEADALPLIYLIPIRCDLWNMPRVGWLGNDELPMPEEWELVEAWQGREKYDVIVVSDAGVSVSSLLHRLRQIRSRQWSSALVLPEHLALHPDIAEELNRLYGPGSRLPGPDGWWCWSVLPIARTPEELAGQLEKIDPVRFHAMGGMFAQLYKLPVEWEKQEPIQYRFFPEDLWKWQISWYRFWPWGVIWCLWLLFRLPGGRRKQWAGRVGGCELGISLGILAGGCIVGGFVAGWPWNLLALPVALPALALSRIRVKGCRWTMIPALMGISGMGYYGGLGFVSMVLAAVSAGNICDGAKQSRSLIFGAVIGLLLVLPGVTSGSLSMGGILLLALLFYLPPALRL